jgi:hypothetical protein
MIANDPSTKGNVMKLRKLSAFSAAALLAGGISFAAAQSQAPTTQSPPGTSAAAQGKCWDAATNTVKDKSTQTASGQQQSGGVTSGSGTSGNAANSTGSQLQTKPAGMANC